MHDLTRALTAGHPNWPGDAPFRLELTADMTQGSSVNIMQLSTSTHSGTHLDAPFHYGGEKLGSVDLATLIGPARVMDARAGVSLGLLEPFPTLPARVLFFTGEPAHWEVFPETFTPLTLELIHALADRGVKLVGTDAPSVDAFTSKDLPTHKACLERGVWILEGLTLQGVTPGEYELVCLPLNLPDADASPVRAVLR